MRDSLPSYRRFLAPVLLVLLAAIGPEVMQGQEALSIRLKKQATEKQDIIQKLTDSIKSLQGQISAPVLTSMEGELRADKTALASLQKDIQVAEGDEDYIASLKLLKQQVRGRASTTFLNSIENEITAEQAKLAKLGQAALASHSTPGEGSTTKVSPAGDVAGVTIPNAPSPTRTPHAKPGPTSSSSNQNVQSTPGQQASSAATVSAPSRVAKSSATPDAKRSGTSVQATGRDALPREGKETQDPVSGRGNAQKSAHASEFRVYAEPGSNAVSGTAEYGDEVQVRINDNEKEVYPVNPVKVDKNNKFKIILPHRLSAFDTVAACMRKGETGQCGQWTKTITLLPLARTGAYLTRLLGGIDYTAASSSNSKQNFFADAFLAVAPRPSEDADDKRSFWIWGDLRLMSIPSLNTPLSVSQISDQSFIQPGLSNLQKLTAAVQFAGGVQYKLPWPRIHALPSTTLSFLLGGGATTPFASPHPISIYNNNQSIQKRYPQVPKDMTAYPYVAFETPERDRFYRQYFGGLRLMTFKNRVQGWDREPFPSLLDVTYGQDEAATGGSVRGGIFRLDGSMSLQYIGEPWLYIFGTAEMKLTRHKVFDPLILTSNFPAGRTPTADASDVFPLRIPPPDRDLFRIGIGIDFTKIILRKGTPQK